MPDPSEILTRLHRILSAADERGLDETECRAMRDAADAIGLLRDERDEARRMYCEAVILHGTAHRFDANGVPEEITEAEELARRLKWDCFKEDTND